MATEKTRKSTVKVRQKPKKFTPTLDREVTTKLYIINEYTLGRSFEEIAEDTGWDVDSIRLEIRQFFISLKQIVETQSLIDQQEADQNLPVKSKKRIALYRNQKKIDEDINEKFLEKLSGPEDQVLTQEEVLFCYLMVHEGDEIAALTESGLAEGLNDKADTYVRAARLRCLMLKGKVNIIKYINGLQIDYAKELNVNKEMIQSELISLIRQYKAMHDPRLAPTIAKLTEQLGRTTGAFTDRVEVSELSFDDAMDKMMEMRKVKEAEAKAKGEEPSTYVYDPENIK